MIKDFEVCIRLIYYSFVIFYDVSYFCFFYFIVVYGCYCLYLFVFDLFEEIFEVNVFGMFNR